MNTNMSTALIKQAASQASKQIINRTAQQVATRVANQVVTKSSAAIERAVTNSANAAVNRALGRMNNYSRRSRAVNRTRGGNRVDFNASTRWTAIAPTNYATSMQGGSRSLRVRQTEIIGKIGANTSGWWSPTVDKYSVFTLPINPANPTTFPWLSYIARLYDKYRFHKLIFRYVNSVSTATRGNFMMALDFDTLDKAPSSLIEASQLAKYQLTPVYVPAQFSIPLNRPGSRSWLYTFDLAATSSTVDLKTYNLGNVFIALDGLDPTGPTDFGYLTVEYDVELIDKNPVIDVFSSMTYDSGLQVSKRNRSAVDPADTMDLSYSFTRKQDTSGDVHYSGIVFTWTISSDVPVGTKMRCLVTQLIDAQEYGSQPIFELVDFENCEDLNSFIYMSTSEHHQLIGYSINLDITVPQNRQFSYYLRVPYEDGVTEPIVEKSNVMSYTYA